MARQYERVAVSTISAMYTAQPALTQRYLMAPILHPLTLCLHAPGSYSTLILGNLGGVCYHKYCMQCSTIPHTGSSLSPHPSSFRSSHVNVQKLWHNLGVLEVMVFTLGWGCINPDLTNTAQVVAACDFVNH